MFQSHERIKFDQSEIIFGTALRHVIPYFIYSGTITFNPRKHARNNDLVLFRINKIPKMEKKKIAFKSNIIERCYYRENQHLFSNEDLIESLAISTVGSRYATLSFGGGLFNPLSGELNGVIKGGKIIKNLGRMNIVGYINYNYGEEEAVDLDVIGVVVDKREKAINLTKFTEDLKPTSKKRGSCCKILVLGTDMECGKTTCAKALATELIKKGFVVTFEKKTGGPFCKDWINVFNKEKRPFNDVSTKVKLNLKEFNGRDFVDATGCVSSHTLDNPTEFINKSLTFTNNFIQERESEFHIMELAGNISEGPNLLLLTNIIFKNSIDIIILTAPQSYEVVHQCIYYLNKYLRYDKDKIILSGFIGNDDCNTLIQDEIKLRLQLPICKSCNIKGDKIEPYGKELFDEVQEIWRKD